MSSNIVSTTIDATYPVAGQDNDTQGFRDNFAVIKTNFAYAATEITDLQNNSARLDQTNNFQGSNILDAHFNQCTESYLAVGTVTAGQNISFLNGSYQSITLSLGESTSSINFTLSDWPATTVENRLASIIVEFKCVDTVAKTATFTVEGGGTIKKPSSFPSPLLIDGTNPVIVKFWTYNAGATVFAEYMGKFV